MQNFDMKTGSAARIRKAMLIIGIIAVISIFTWNVLHMAGISSYETYPTKAEELKDWMKLPRECINIARWDAVVGMFLALTVAGLLIAHTVMQSLKINKSNVKNEITTTAVNGVVGLVIVAFVIYVLTFIFKNDQWSYFEKDGYALTSIMIAEKTHYGFVAMGILMPTVLYATVFAGAYNRPSLGGKEANVKLFRTIALFMFSAAMIALVAIAATCAGGFRNLKEVVNKLEESTPWTDDWNKYGAQQNEGWASIYEGKYLLGTIGAIALFAAALIPCGIFAFEDKAKKNKNIIIYSVLSALTLVFFIVACVFVKIGKFSEEMSSEPKWFTDTPTVTAMILVGYILALVTGSVAYGTTHKLETKIKKVVTVQPAA